MPRSKSRRKPRLPPVVPTRTVAPRAPRAPRRFAPPPARRPLDLFGVAALLSLSLLYASNNLLIAFGTQGFQPVAMAGFRSAIALLPLVTWMVLRRLPFRLDLWRPGLAVGTVFAIEFFLLFIALDLTTVVRAAILFYAMPLWTAVLAHFLFPGERLTPIRLTGFLLGFAAVALTVATRVAGGPEAAMAGGSLLGDLAALAGGLFWALIIVVVRQTRLSETLPETQLFWQLLVSAPLLLAMAPLYGGPWLRAVDGWQLLNLGVQGLVIAAGGFLAWFHMLRRYPSGSVASFGFVAPMVSVFLGWAVLGETVSAMTPVALGLLVAGLWLINRR